MQTGVERDRGFAIIEILIAITILSTVLLTVISGVSAGIVAITGNKNLTIAMTIAKNKLNEFQLLNMRGADIKSEDVKEYPGFKFSRDSKRYVIAMFGRIDA